jgi:hypothetical protein
LALAIGILTGALTTSVLLPDSDHTHEATDYTDTEYHTHADFLIMADNEKINLAEESFMTIATRILHPGVHLHDNNGDVIHFHQPGITLPVFLESIGFALDPTCLTTPDSEFCVNNTDALQMYVNGQDKTTDLASYVPADEDRVLLYYGPRENPNLSSYLESVTDDACFYSGTCPERGTAPAESCGLFCEL